jgi:hypothetical protein
MDHCAVGEFCSYELFLSYARKGYTTLHNYGTLHQHCFVYYRLTVMINSNYTCLLKMVETMHGYHLLLVKHNVI